MELRILPVNLITVKLHVKLIGKNGLQNEIEVIS